jgi:hypothetical protein
LYKVQHTFETLFSKLNTFREPWCCSKSLPYQTCYINTLIRAHKHTHTHNTTLKINVIKFRHIRRHLPMSVAECIHRLVPYTDHCHKVINSYGIYFPPCNSTTNHCLYKNSYISVLGSYARMSHNPCEWKDFLTQIWLLLVSFTSSFATAKYLQLFILLRATSYWPHTVSLTSFLLCDYTQNACICFYLCNKIKQICLKHYIFQAEQCLQVRVAI